MMKFIRLSTVFFLMASNTVFANQGYEIALEADRRQSGYGDSEASVIMTLISKSGAEDRRELTIKELEGDGAENQDKSLMVFDDPRDIAGTALLTWSRPDDDLQWLYLPAIKRVKAISSSNKSGAFMGSEFTFEDLSPQEVDSYLYKYVGEEACGEQNCFVYERRSKKDQESGYTKELLWVDQKEYRTQKVHFYDHKNEHTKTLTFSGYKQYEGEFWRPGELFMENLETGRKTRMSFSTYRFGQNLHDSDFSRSQLRYGR